MAVTYTKHAGSQVIGRGSVPTFREAYERLRALDASSEVNTMAVVTDESGEELAHALINPPGIHGGYKSMGLTKAGDERAKSGGWVPIL